MKKYLVLAFLLVLASCNNSKIENKETINSTWNIQSGTIVPINEKSTSLEKEFSKELNWLLDSVDEDTNGK